jgi:hypothetical protein
MEYVCLKEIWPNFNEKNNIIATNVEAVANKWIFAKTSFPAFLWFWTKLVEKIVL